MTKVVFAASLAVAVLTGCAVVPYGPGPVAGVAVYAAPAPAIYGYPHRYGSMATLAMGGRATIDPTVGDQVVVIRRHPGRSPPFPHDS